MSNVKIPMGDDPRERAILLLGAAEDLDLDQGMVRTDSEGNFWVPREIADEAGLDYESDDEVVEEKPKPAKKATAKKTAKKSSK